MHHSIHLRHPPLPSQTCDDSFGLMLGGGLAVLIVQSRLNRNPLSLRVCASRIRNTVLENSALSKTIDAMAKILDLAQTAGSGVQLTEQTKGDILTATSLVSHRPEGTGAAKDRAKALQDRLFLSVVRELQPGETIALDAREVQFAGARSSPGNVIKREFQVSCVHHGAYT